MTSRPDLKEDNFILSVLWFESTMFPMTSLFDWSQMLAVFGRLRKPYFRLAGRSRLLVCRNILLLTASWTGLCFLVHDEKRIFQTRHTYGDGLHPLKPLTAFSKTWTKLNLSFHNQFPSDVPSQQWKSTKTITTLTCFPMTPGTQRHTHIRQRHSQGSWLWGQSVC